MKTIYLDSEFKCHVVNDGTMMAIETEFFDGKCNFYIEGYRFVPFGYSWTNPDGITYHGEMITAWKPYSELKIAQKEYEQEVRFAILEEECTALRKENAMLTQCILEMSEVIYA